jgi:hypothetical protein
MADMLQWVLLGLAVWCTPSIVFLACIAFGGVARGRYRADETVVQRRMQRLSAYAD